MKNYISLFLLIITTSCFSQIFHKEKTIIQGDKITLIKSTMKPVDGTVIEFHENKELKSETNYKNGLKEGIQKSWYENGQLQEETKWIRGEKDGLHKEWYDNGQLKSKIISKWDGPHFKLYESYTDKGILEFKIIDGYTTYYYENGKPQCYGYFGPGFSNSACIKSWHENGSLKSLIQTHENLMVIKEFDDNGDFLRVVKLKNKNGEAIPIPKKYLDERWNYYIKDNSWIKENGNRLTVENDDYRVLITHHHPGYNYMCGSTLCEIIEFD